MLIFLDESCSLVCDELIEVSHEHKIFVVLTFVVFFKNRNDYSRDFQFFLFLISKDKGVIFTDQISQTNKNKIKKIKKIFLIREILFSQIEDPKKPKSPCERE